MRGAILTPVNFFCNPLITNNKHTKLAVDLSTVISDNKIMKTDKGLRLMYIKIDLVDGTSTKLNMDEELREHLFEAHKVEGAVDTWLDEEFMIIKIK